jgi:hypothetical protein
VSATDLGAEEVTPRSVLEDRARRWAAFVVIAMVVIGAFAGGVL